MTEVSVETCFANLRVSSFSLKFWHIPLLKIYFESHSLRSWPRTNLNFYGFNRIKPLGCSRKSHSNRSSCLARDIIQKFCLKYSSPSTEVNAFWFVLQSSYFLRNDMDFDTTHIPRLFWSKRIAGLNKQRLASGVTPKRRPLQNRLEIAWNLDWHRNKQQQNLRPSTNLARVFVL